VNPQHFRAYCWLQWRLRINQLKRGGIANVVVLAILAAGAVLLSLGLFAMFVLIGVFALPEASPTVLMYIWDGVAVAFLFFWMIGLLADLQRAEALSLDKFLHLPVSLSGAFVLNYLASLVSLTLVLFLPAMIGLLLGSVISHGPAMLLLVPLLAAFLLMVTALTYQFQGWLASLMVNKRRRRTVIVLLTGGFILLSQLPYLINFMQPWQSRHEGFVKEHAERWRAVQAGKITGEEFQKWQEETQRKQNAENQQTMHHVEAVARLANLFLPPGWLPYGAKAAAEGNYLPVFLGTLGMGLLGAASLWRAYRTTVRLYMGQFTAGSKQMPAIPEAAKSAESSTPPRPAKPTARRPGLLEWNLPWLSEETAAIALGGFRSLWRAPESKMLLLTPLIMVLIFGGIFMRHSMDLPIAVRPLLPFAAMGMILLTMVQLVGNQFGFDRGGFRVFVLCPARRRDILLGKNLAVVPFAFTMGAAALILLQIVYPMPIDYFLAIVPQFISMYLLFCLLANCLSIIAPMAIASGTLRPSNAKMIPVLLNVAYMFLFPIVVAPTLLPLGVEVVLETLDWVHGLPVCLVLSVLECVAIVFAFRWLVGWQGAWLQSRELRILELVTTKVE
jgi:ABC-2 type transport system permease protein